MRTTRGPSTRTRTTPPAARSLVSDQLRLTQLLLPVRAQAAMGRAANRVLVHSDARREEPGGEIEPGVGRAAGHDHPATREGLELADLRPEALERRFVVELDQHVESIRPAKRIDAGIAASSTASSSGERDLRRHRLAREVELDAVRAATGGEQAAPGLEARGQLVGDVPFLPEDVRRRQGRVAAEVDLRVGREPPQIEVGLTIQAAPRTRSRRGSSRPPHPASTGRPAAPARRRPRRDCRRNVDR